MNINDNPSQEDARRKKQRKLPKKKLTNKNYVVKLKIVCQKFVFLLILGGIKMIDYLRNLFISWFNKILNWFSERQKKEMNTKKEIPFGKNKHADDDRAKRISEGFQALDEGCKSIANLRAEIEMSQTESKTFKDNEPKVNNDLDAPVPANNNIKNNLEEYKMGNFWGPKTPEECQKEIEKHEQQIKELEKKKLKFQNKEGVTPIKPVGQEKVLSSNISPISMRSNSDNNSINEYKPFLETPANSNNAKFNEIDKQFQQNGQRMEKLEQKNQQLENKLAENTNDMNKLKEQVNNHEEKINKNTEDIKKNTEDIKKTQEEQIDIKKLLAKHDVMIADQKKMLEDMKQLTADIHKQTEEIKQQTVKMDEKWREHDAKWMEMFGPYLKKKPRSSRNDNRESTNTSFSSFRGYMNMNNSQIPRMERADMAHSHDENQ